MIMFAKGRNLAYIQEELFISKSTVSTHRQHIYKKLGIHSQQELLDLVSTRQFPQK
ncbi:MAG: response regulator transcription factor [Adlercreutzia equolifaciens]